MLWLLPARVAHEVGGRRLDGENPGVRADAA